MGKPDYSKYTDEELIEMHRAGSEDIPDFLIKKYNDLVKGKASKLFLIGGDQQDLEQEGRMGLYNAIRDFDAGRDASFATFANLCVTRKMYSAIEASNREKHWPMVGYQSIYDADFQKEGGINPEEELLDKEKVSMLEKRLSAELSSLENQVVDLKVIGMDYQEIAAVLGKTPKSIDNAITRIKSKLKKVLTEIK